MSTYNNLPVYRESYALLIEIFFFGKNFSREYRYTLGENIKKEMLEMIKNIYRANRNFSKEESISLARENLETVRLYLRLLQDLKQINLRRFVQFNEKIESVSNFRWLLLLCRDNLEKRFKLSIAPEFQEMICGRKILFRELLQE
ncbi:MAG: four helix bundle protein [Candidatus Pacebacteria bacterium]|nr:four helix bundle protein [Candidatus Paceibacterota bacterium]